MFLLFPVIDFQTFQRTHYDKPAFAIYGEGVRWMFRGLTHLVIYRLIYQYVALSPADVTSTAELVQYLVGNYRPCTCACRGSSTSSSGMLHLFGFRLPETHRFFYLASSFSDLWRRINIYWKDFMQKMVYLPVVFGLKRQGETTVACGRDHRASFGATWFLHSYQWFWLLGTWLFSATDMVFWGVFGVLLIVNTLREQRRGRPRQLTAQAPASQRCLARGLADGRNVCADGVALGILDQPDVRRFPRHAARRHVPDVRCRQSCGARWRRGRGGVTSVAASPWARRPRWRCGRAGSIRWSWPRCRWRSSGWRATRP